jgi:hypothetical protein
MDQRIPGEPNPRRVATGRANRHKRGPLTADGRKRLSEAALQHKPWRHSTGPTSAAGRARSAENGREHQAGPLSARQTRAELRMTRALIRVFDRTLRKVPRG